MITLKEIPVLKAGIDRLLESSDTETFINGHDMKTIITIYKEPERLIHPQIYPHKTILFINFLLQLGRGEIITSWNSF